MIAHHDALRIGQRNSERCCRQLISGFLYWFEYSLLKLLMLFLCS
jgi:hypothetical protein